jgi:hypothetical protein
MLYNEFKDSLKKGMKCTFVYRSRNDGKLKRVVDATVVNVYHKKAMATFQFFNGTPRAFRLIAITEFNGEKIYW